MSDKPTILEDLIDAVFRPILAFFMGMFLGYGAQLAQVSHWAVAAIFMLICLLIVGFVIFLHGLFYRGMDAIFDKIGLGSGVKPARRPVKQRKHWFVRFGWVPFIAFGAAAVFLLPADMLDWLT